MGCKSKETPESKTRVVPAKPKGRRARHRLREMVAVLLHHDLGRGLTPVKLRLILEDLGPTFVKFGQILSMRQDILPKAYCDELMKLRASVKPLDWDDVVRAIREEYGGGPEEVFRSFDREPLGSASIAQVHRAVLPTGEPVVVKIQRPCIRETMEQDMKLLHRAAGLLKLSPGLSSTVDFHMVLDEMWAVAQQEMDFLKEARNAEEFASRNREVAYVGCPKIYHQYTTGKVLVMEYIDGLRIDDMEALEKHGYDRKEIGRKLADNYVKQIVDDAFFHADPHPGNIRIREGKIVFIDLGMMGRLTKRDQNLLKRGVAAVVSGDVEELKTVLLTLGARNGPVNHSQLYGDIDDFLLRYGSMEMGELDLARMLEEVLDLASRHNIAMPAGISMLARGAMTLQGVLTAVDPEISIVEIMAHHLTEDAVRKVDWKKELQNSGQALYASGKKALDIPAQLSDILKMTIKGQTKLNMELTGEKESLYRADRMVNRLILGLLIGALIVGSSLLCLSSMIPRPLGIPWLGWVGYSAALLLGIRLWWTGRRKR